MLNPYSSTHSRNPDYTSQPDDQSGPTLSQLLQTTWIATGVSFLALTIVSAVTLDRSITHLTLSDDSYAAAFAASLPVTTFFAVGSLVGWWFQSTRIAKIATFVPLVTFGTLLWLMDRVYFFGEGEDLVGYLGVGILLGGVFGFPAFLVHNCIARTVLSVVPHFVLGIGYLTAVSSMLGW